MPRRRRIWKRRRYVDARAGLSVDERTYATQLACFGEEVARRRVVEMVFHRIADDVYPEDSFWALDASEAEIQATDERFDARVLEEAARHPLLSSWPDEVQRELEEWQESQSRGPESHPSNKSGGH
jgi:hypothetical protein